MKDLIEHMSRCHDQLELTKDGDTQSFLADALMGDLNECQKLCEQLRSIEARQSRSPRACSLVRLGWITTLSRHACGSKTSTGRCKL